MQKEYQFSRKIITDVFRIKLPLPGRKPGPVNVYLFKGDEITLMDTGTVQTTSLLRKALQEHNLDFSDISKIIITHGHPDHYGAVKRIVKAGKAQVLAHRGDKRMMETGRDVSAKKYNDFLRIIGVPRSTGMMLNLSSLIFRFMAERCTMDIILREGDEVNIGKYRARILETPGHSKGSICFFLEREGILFCGDTLIQHITPNAFFMLDEDNDLPVRLSQEEFYQSLDKIRKLAPSIIFSAHGKTVTDVDQIIAGYQRAFAQRKENVMRILRNGERSVYRTARILFPDIGGSRLLLEIFLSISEVYTTMQVLQKEGRVSFKIRNGKLEVAPTE
ncbi:MAG TPA: MBL fold metallo-hydrolase [Smithella sp.]|nr:MBL fold metallo-hydrolase [Smithella sp.]MDM7988533.1 MBL fold metallo-hydrolase [Smithella sp.]HNY48930.1 MBL fold metallo-hydrolase [Smithella sp.]HOG89014.1 MBL fold metallo-hydrolase [Smithella sp.]HOU49730.1 MBL fold metallo-hydrolase [Smithella sp.]